jgi:hypothetical protein
VRRRQAVPGQPRAEQLQHQDLEQRARRARRWSYLVFDFSTSSFLGGRRTNTTVETLVKPRAGYRYEANVTYRDDIFNVVIREQSPRGAWREVAFRDLASCTK